MFCRLLTNIDASPVVLCKPMEAFFAVKRGKKKFKENVARAFPLKNPSGIALENFDFYYGPVFGKKWPSIRLGLLTPNKYFAVLNRFSSLVVNIYFPQSFDLYLKIFQVQFKSYNICLESA